MGANAIPQNQAFELEVSLRRGTHGRYVCELRFQSPDSEADRRSDSMLPPLDFSELDGLRFDPTKYGDTIGRWLTSGKKTREELGHAIARSQEANGTLRVRLSIGDGSAELHRVRWETLRLPDTDRSLFLGENIVFSRYINSTDYRRVQRRPRGELRALVAVANPANIAAAGAEFNVRLAPIDRPGEIARAKTALTGIQVDAIDPPHAVTLEAILSALRSQSYDILYLVCHGAIVDGQPHLWLESADGSADVVAGDEFKTRLSELRQRPSLVVLASCESGGAQNPGAVPAETSDDDLTEPADGVLSALGPLLAEEGIPAVLAMQGSVTLATIETFMPAFFTELAIDGQLDRAVSVARGKVRDRIDAWAPVLFSRLKGGGIWYRLGWDAGNGFQRWRALKQAIADGKCTPILGPGLLESIQGSRREIARELGDQFDFPLARQDRDELPQVAQYWLVKESRDALVSDYLGALCARIQRRYRDVLPPDLLAPFSRTPAPTSELRDRVMALLRSVWTQRSQAGGGDSHALLASLDFPVFISTNPDPLMSDAIKAAKGDPSVELFRWSSFLADDAPPTADGQEKKYDKLHPLVFHLFGHLDTPDSLVLAQDDYFDALITASGPRALPRAVKSALTDRTLLFLGFNIDDWNFRVLYRLILALPGSELLRRRAHVAVQIDPEEQRFYDPRAARRYLEQYFRAQNIEIYWGTVDDFIRDLTRQPAEGGGVA